MGEIVDMLDKIKRYFYFTPLEIRGLITAILVIAFVFSFREWGYGSDFNFRIGLLNFFNAILIVAVSFLIHISVQRIWSLGVGYKLEWKMWTFGLLFSLIMAFLTNGAAWWLIIPGGFMVHHMAGARLGFFRYGINYWAIGLIAVTGTFATIFLITIFKAISGFVFNSLIQKLIMFNIAYAICSVIPIPPLDGSKTFYGSRMLYAFSTPAIISAAILLKSSLGVGIVIALSILIAIALWAMYYIFFEWKAWKE